MKPPRTHYEIAGPAGLGFTLVELLAVIAIIGLLSTVAVIATQGAREKARLAAQLQSDTALEHKLGYQTVGSWGLDEGSGTAIGDSSGLGNGGALTGTVNGSTWTAGIKGGAIYFNSSFPNYVTLTKSISLPMNSFTVTAWFKTTSGADQKIFSTSISHVQLSTLSGTLRVCALSCTNGTRTYNDGLWHFAVATGDGASTRGYVDGILQTTQANNATVMSGIPRIGIHGAGGGSDPAVLPFNGTIDEVKAYAEAMTAEDIRKIYLAGRAAHPGLLAEN